MHSRFWRTHSVLNSLFWRLTFSSKRSFFDQGICGIFPTRIKFFACHLKRVAIIRTESAENSIHDDINVLEGNTISPNDGIHERHYLCLVSHELKKLAHMQLTTLVRFQNAGLMTTKIHHNTLEH